MAADIQRGNAVDVDAKRRKMMATTRDSPDKSSESRNSCTGKDTEFKIALHLLRNLNPRFYWSQSALNRGIQVSLYRKEYKPKTKKEEKENDMLNGIFIKKSVTVSVSYRYV